MPTVRERLAQSDLARCIAVNDARKAANAAARARARANPDLCAMLLEHARRRGRSEIDWQEYFRNAYIAD